jgi:hypothetical protein
MNATIRSLALVLFSTALLAIPARVVGQARPSPASLSNAICAHDPRPDIRVFCDALIDLQAKVNAGIETDFRPFLSKLDLSNAAATVKFVTATADALAAEAVVSKADATIALREAGQARLDRQLGAGSNASGTTSLVSRTGTAELLSLALDTGALTQSINGTTATLGTNADQVFRLITGSDPDCTATCNSLGWFENKVLNPTNFSASFDLAQQSSKTTATSGQASGTTPTQVGNVALPTGAGRFSALTARYELLNRFDPRSVAFQQRWKSAVKKSETLKAALTSLGSATDQVRKVVVARATPLDGSAMLQKARGDPSGKALVEFFHDYFSDASEAVMKDPQLPAAVSLVMRDRAVYRDAWFSALHEAVGNLVTFQYSYNRPLNQPQTHEFKLIYGYDFKTMGMFTFNGAVSVYGGAIPAGAKYGRLHYGQISTEYDRTLSGAEKALQTQLSLAGYWQYQSNPSVLNIAAGTVVPGTTIPLPNGTQEFVGTAGSLWVTQALVTIKGSGGINVPIGVSWSNKTDLLRGSKVGAQFGIVYNFWSLAGLFGRSQGGQ